MAGAKKSRKVKGKDDLKFEEAIASLEKIVQELEGADVPLEKALEMFEEGVKLSKICHRKLREAEKKVQVLLEDQEGGFELQSLEEEEAEDEEGAEETEGPERLF